MDDEEEIEEESNSQVYKRLHKMDLEDAGEIHCSRCKYHRGDNANGERTARRSWKRRRKARKQWNCQKGPRRG